MRISVTQGKNVLRSSRMFCCDVWVALTNLFVSENLLKTLTTYAALRLTVPPKVLSIQQTHCDTIFENRYKICKEER